MVKPTLLVLAAGMGSRYGSLKQMDGVGPNNEAIIDYSVYDAIRAGFGKVVFVIRHSFEKEFREVFSAERFGGRIAVEFVFQELDYLPEGASVAVITNDYHLARARRLLAHAGLGDAGVPAKTPYPSQWAAVRCREYSSIMGLILTGLW